MRRPLNPPISVSQPFASTAFDYSPYGLKGHHGVDYVAGVGTPIYAPENGTILQSANGVTDPKSGRFAAGETIIMSGSYEHWLMHLSRRLVSAGQSVTEGQLIGYTGNTGVSTGPHLHWGVRPLTPNLNNGYRGFIDPSIVLNTPQGGSMSTTDLGIARILAYGILGRNQSPNNALAGQCDDDLNKHHVGKETNGKIWEFYNSPEGKTWREQRLPGLVTENATLKSNIAVVIADRDGLIKKLDSANQTINTQADALTKLTNENNQLKETVKTQEAEIARLKNELSNCSTTSNEQEVVQNWLKRIWKDLFKKGN